MGSELRTAVILAAGMGTRLQGLVSDRPKGFVEFGGETLVERALRLLAERGIERTVIVAGHMAHAYHELAKSRSGVEVVENSAFADTGSMASLACALEVVHDDFVLLESDLFFEARALDAVVGTTAPDVMLAELELVGILRVSAKLGLLMKRAFDDFVAERGHGRMSYETDALVTAARERPVRVHVISDLLWGEVDYESHFHRVRDEIWPACRDLEDSLKTEPV